MSEGEIINYMQLDSERLEDFVLQATSLWDGLYQIAGYLLVIYLLIGEHSFLGLAVMAAAIPVNLIMFTFIAVVYRRMAKCTDNRTQMTNEMLQAILGVKVSAWGGDFSRQDQWTAQKGVAPAETSADTCRDGCGYYFHASNFGGSNCDQLLRAGKWSDRRSNAFRSRLWIRLPHFSFL